VVKGCLIGVDANKVSRHRLDERADRTSATIPRPRVSEPASRDGALKVWEWHRLGRRCLFVEAAGGRTVGMLNVNTGVVTLSNEKERPLFEAAIVAWFTAALDEPAPAPAEPSARQTSEPLTADHAPERATSVVEQPRIRSRAAAPVKVPGACRRRLVGVLLGRFAGQAADEPGRHRKVRIRQDGR
jgi:hypothetical protein